MATGTRQKAVDFAAGHMKKNSDITMSELKDKASKHGINIYPLIIGLARKQLGMASGRAAPAASAASAPTNGRRKKKASKAGRKPRAAAPSSEIGSLSSIVEHVQRLEEDVQGMRQALADIAAIAGRYA